MVESFRIGGREFCTLVGHLRSGPPLAQQAECQGKFTPPPRPALPPPQPRSPKIAHAEASGLLCTSSPASSAATTNFSSTTSKPKMRLSASRMSCGRPTAETPLSLSSTSTSSLFVNCARNRHATSLLPLPNGAGSVCPGTFVLLHVRQVQLHLPALHRHPRTAGLGQLVNPPR